VAKECALGSPTEVLGQAISRFKQEADVAVERPVEPGLGPLLARYEEALARRGAVDLDDLVIQPCRYLRGAPEAAGRIASRYGVVAVDEYQDVNNAQAELVSLLAPGGKTLCAIGDPDQAIYAFRGARPGHFRRFAEAFPGARVVTLGTSYRLTREILAAAAGVLGRAPGLRATRSGPPVELVTCPTAASEAEQLVVRLERIVGGTSHFAVDSGRGEGAEHDDVSFGDVAVLCRTRAQRAEVLAALGRSGVPCRTVGEEEPHDPRSEKVAVMTLHAAKGREFEVVFVVGVEEGLLPLDHGGLRGDPDEERRLLYVAMTRARRLLVLSHAVRRTLWGRTLPGRPSPLLLGVPDSVAVRTTPGSGRPDPSSRQLSLF
jgi:DNA helicase-2/ATP-dependent DNA helicase PcrA